MLRYVVLQIVFAGSFIVLTATGAGNAEPLKTGHSACIEVSLDATFLCVGLTFTVTGGGNIHEFVEVDWGDGTKDVPDCVGAGGPCTGTVPHTYDEEGEYSVMVTALTGCPGAFETIAATVTASPSFPLYAAAGETNWVQPATSEPFDVGTLRRSTIDWGDGTPAEEFEWVDTGTGELSAPVHYYANPGEYTVVARVEYLGAWEGTCYERVGTFQAVVTAPTPTERTNWGALKARYR
jgi:hypothetical protein